MGKHIALLCMSLNIGGAETHIYELAKALTAQGHTVTVFSNGGVYADALQQEGIRHIKTPLHTKTASSLLTSYRILKQEFKTNRPSVVHSHTRISNFIGGMVCRKLHLPMVTTVHFNFRCNFFFRRFSDWGQRALAVSEDLKTYLVKNYQYNPAHVALTVNGIDMERFKKQDASAFRASLGIAPEEKMILMVSRLDKEASIHVSRFLDIAPKVFKRVPDSRLVIVGNGKLYRDFERRAEEINRALGKEFILMQGAKTNIEEYTAAADLFVGISRSALEAMASKVPTVLLGNLGYLGLYSDAIQKECIETNLTCRGYPYPKEEALIDLVCGCLTGKDLSTETEEGYRLVQNHFSIHIMADSALAQYQSAIEEMRPLDYMIGGYYGTDNFGDNLTLSLLLGHLKGKKGSFLTHNMNQTVPAPSVQKVHRFNLWTIRRLMKQTKVFLLGCGSILQDATSNRSIFYYHFLIRMALRYHCKVMLYANGIGPINRSTNQKRTTKLLNKIDLITARDQESIQLLHRLSVYCPIVQTADDVFSLQLPKEQALSLPKEAEGKTVVGINFKLNTNETENIDALAGALNNLARRHALYYLLLPFHLEQDTPALKALQSRLDSGISHLAEELRNPTDIIQHIRAGQYQIFERLHGQVVATILGTPFLPINYDPKNYSLALQLGMENLAVDHSDITEEHIEAAFEQLLAQQEIIRKKMETYTENACKKAALNREWLIKLIEDY